MESSSTGATRNSGKRPAEVAGECPERKQQKLYGDIEDDELINIVMERSLKNHQFSKNLVGKLLYRDSNAIVDEQLLQILMSRMVNDNFVSFVGNKLDPLLNRQFSDGSKFMQKQEELFRKVVQEEKNIFGCLYVSQDPRQINQIQNIRYFLKFNEDLPTETYARDKLTINIRMCDTQASDCKFSGKVEVVVLKGGFCPDEKGTIGREEFREQIQEPRPRKGPLLVVVGQSNDKVVVELKDGVGSVVVQFMDNSSGTTTGTFKLGARLCEKEELFGEVHGVSRAIRVLDARSKGNQRPKIPSLNDEVHCLKNIAKGGSYHRRLQEKHICNVQQFLQALAIDPKGLKDVISGGNRGLSKEKWEEIVENAKMCDHRLTITVDGATLVFNSVFELLGVELNGEYKIVSEYPASQRAVIEKWKKTAFSQIENIRVVDNLAGSSSELTNVRMDQNISCPNGSQLSNNADGNTNLSIPEVLSPGTSEWINSFDLEKVMKDISKEETTIRWLKLKIGLRFFGSLMTLRVPKNEGAN